MRTPNKGNRTLFESIMAPEVITALQAFTPAMTSGVLVGGLALSYYVKPRYTQDVDVLYLTEDDIPQLVTYFKRIRQHSFEHLATGVEIEVFTPEHLGIPKRLVERVIETSVEQHGIKVASPSGIVALKLMRLSWMDKADIVALIEYTTIDLTGFDIPHDRMAKYVALVNELDS